MSTYRNLMPARDVTVVGVTVAMATVASVMMHIYLTLATMRNHSGYSY
jgi:hypothetical protein